MTRLYFRKWISPIPIFRRESDLNFVIENISIDFFKSIKNKSDILKPGILVKYYKESYYLSKIDNCNREEKDGYEAPEKKLNFDKGNHPKNI